MCVCELWYYIQPILFLNENQYQAGKAVCPEETIYLTERRFMHI